MTASTQTSSGAGSAGQIVALNASGLIDSTMLPDTVTQSITASETIAAGALISVWNNTGVAVRNADNTSTAKQADGFAPSAITNGSSGSVTLQPAVITGLAGLTVGTRYFLGTTGGLVSAAPTAVGTITQYAGVALATTSLSFQIGQVFDN